MNDVNAIGLITGSDIRRAAMDLLARREHAVGELHRKLNARFRDCNEQIDEEIRRLTEEGLQSDARLAEAFVNSRIGKGQGPLKIRRELQLREVNSEIISIAFEHSGIDWAALAASVLEKKFGVGVLTDKTFNPKEKGRRARFLQQRGFTFEQISSLL
jgi:regulatory protein